METLYHLYLKCFYGSMVINPLGPGVFSVPSTRPNYPPYTLHYDGKGLPLCNCEAGQHKMNCKHMAGVIAFVHSGIQAGWDHRRIFEANRRALLIRQGKVNPRKIPKVRQAMNEINERHPRAPLEPKCTSCGVALEYSGTDLCLPCIRRLSKIWPDDSAFAAELEQVDKDEAMRLSLGMGE